MLKRYLEKEILEDLKKKMVFISGPRQVGKTTFSQALEKKYKKPLYLNWDTRSDRRKIINSEFKSDADLIIFDEIHKYKKWKNYLKGVFDTYNQKFAILVTGSARLDIYQKGGDSMMGRYYHYRLHPITLAEFLEIKNKTKPFDKFKFFETKEAIQVFKDLFIFGGFPEPFLEKSKKTLRRWQDNRLDRLVEEDIRDVELVRDLSSLQILSDILPQKVGSLFSINSLVGDLEVTHKTLKNWIEILEKFYFHFRIYPYTASNKIDFLKKEPKLFLWDYSVIENEGAKFENLIAAHLLKFVQYLKDSEGYKVELKFIRDTEGREVDFLVTVDKKPWFSVETKLKKETISKNIFYFKKKLNIPFNFQVVKETGIDFTKDNVRVISADKFLTGLV